MRKSSPFIKGGVETDPSNYSPISLLSLFNRLFEKIVYNGLKSYVEQNGLLYNGQYGFREKMSTQHAIIDILLTQFKAIRITGCSLAVFFST